MRLSACVAALCAAPVVAADASPSALPRAFAGYSQVAITPGMCKVVGAAEAQCVIPAMSAGRYLIEATGTSTSPGVAPQQALEIVVGGASCGMGRNGKPWSSGPRAFRLDCEATILTDTPLTVRALYADVQATKDAQGPVLTIRALPWNGVLAGHVFAPKQ